jgi:hypothetical protein
MITRKQLVDIAIKQLEENQLEVSTSKKNYNISFSSIKECSRILFQQNYIFIFDKHGKSFCFASTKEIANRMIEEFEETKETLFFPDLVSSLKRTIENNINITNIKLEEFKRSGYVL